MTFEPLVPSELENINAETRMNLFRIVFARSRYDRLVIQRTLVKTVTHPELKGTLRKLEKAHDDELARVCASMKSTRFFSEFVRAADEEDAALGDVLHAYERRMERNKEIKNKAL